MLKPGDALCSTLAEAGPGAPQTYVVFGCRCAITLEKTLPAVQGGEVSVAEMIARSGARHEQNHLNDIEAALNDLLELLIKYAGGNFISAILDTKNPALAK